MSKKKKKPTNTAPAQHDLVTTGKSNITTFCARHDLSPADPPQQPVEFTGGTGTSNIKPLPDLTKLTAAELAALAKHHRNQYWNLGDPQITDNDFDRIIDTIKTRDAMAKNTTASNNTNYTTDKAPVPVKRRGRARCYSLDKVTNVSKAMFRITHQRVSILSLEGWYAKLKNANAAEHAANSFAKYSLADRLIGNDIYHAALQMTIARCVDYGKTTEEAAELISRAMEKKTTSLISR
jgi:hypothetical protein